MPQGKIIRALSGFYYIESSHQVYQTRARGVFRKEGSLHWWEILWILQVILWKKEY